MTTTAERFEQVIPRKAAAAHPPTRYANKSLR